MTLSPLKNIVRALVFLSPFVFPFFLLKFQVLGIPFTVLEVFCYTLFVLWVFSGPMAWKRPLSYFWLSAFLLFLGATLGVLIAPHSISLPSGELLDAQRVALGVWKGWIVAPLLYFAVVTQTIQSKKETDFFIRLFVYAGSIVALAAYAFALFNNGITYDLRLSGFFESANYLSLYLVPPLLFSVMLILRRPAVLRFYDYFDLSALAIMGHALFFTQSYAAIIAVFGALFLGFLRLMGRRLFATRSGLIALFVMALTFVIILATQWHTPKFRQALDWQNRSSTSVRLEIYEVAYGLIRENPLAGIGPGLFQAEYQTRGRENLGHVPMEWNIPHPHNIFLAFWLNAGLLGLLALFALIALAHRHFTYALIPFWGILIHGFFDTPFWKNDLAMVFWLTVAVIVILQTHGTHPAQIKAVKTGKRPVRRRLKRA
ncbi:O-antigen ligase family protein [Candidatus Peregrinibacteria bacterium]|nr:O-antigen ligase family protein [Candidatus Peregrinibacteria bacterium]